MFFYFIVRVYFFKQTTAYELRISDWSSDVCSSDLGRAEEADREDDCRGEQLRGHADDIEVARAPREQSGEPGLDEGELDADRDRDRQAAECGRDQRLGPAFEQPARPVEEQEGDEQRRQRQQQQNGRASSRGRGCQYV